MQKVLARPLPAEVALVLVSKLGKKNRPYLIRAQEHAIYFFLGFPSQLQVSESVMLMVSSSLPAIQRIGFCFPFSVEFHLKISLPLKKAAY